MTRRFSLRDASQKRRIRTNVLFTLLVALTSPLRAELPGTAYIYPLGGQIGAKTPIRVGGYYLHDAAPFMITGSNVTASPQIERTEKIWFEGPLIYQPASQGKEDYPADYRGEIAVDANAAPGVRRWSVHTSQGVTPALPFILGRLPEVIEQETDGEPIPVSVHLPVTINGRIFPRQDVDVWTFEAQAGQTVTCAVLAARLGSPLVSRLEILDPQGKAIAEDVGSQAGDAFVQFPAAVSGRYSVRIHDAEFSGLQHYVYRLMVTNGPFATDVFPLGGKPGETLKVELHGANLPAPTIDVHLPDKSGDIFWWHPEGLVAGELGIPLNVTDAAPVAEAEPNDTLEQPQPISLLTDAAGLVLNGRIEKPGDVDQFAFDAKPGAPVRFTVRAAALGSPLDSVLTVFDAKGQQLAQADDTNGPDAALNFTPPAEARYLVSIKDRIAQRGGPEYAYRLHVAVGEDKPAVPFALRVSADIINVDRGAQVNLRIDAQRFGFNEPIELSCENLPPGVALAGTTIGQGANQTNLTFKAEPMAKVGLAAIKIVGTCKRDNQEFKAVATLPPQPSEPVRDTVALSVNVPTPFKIYGKFESKFSPRGSVYVRHYFIDRKGFDGPLEISVADKQNRHLQGTYGPKITIPAGVTEFDYPLTLPPRMELGRTSRTCLMAVGDVALEDGTVAKVAFSSQEQNDQIIVITAPERMQVLLSQDNVLAAPGKEIDLGVRLERDAKLTEATKVELVCPPHLPIAVADPVTLPANETSGRLKLRLKKGELGPINMPVTIRATTTDERGFPVVSQALLELVAPKTP